MRIDIIIYILSQLLLCVATFFLGTDFEIVNGKLRHKEQDK